MRRWLVVIAAWTSIAHADTDDLVGRSIVFQRGNTLVKTDAKGKAESKLADLPAKKSVRALRTDAAGTVLLADVGGTWSYMPLDGSASTLTDLPCAAGPAQLAEDGLCVLCRAKANSGSIIVTLKTGKVVPLDVPTAGARITGIGAERRVVWPDATAVWSAPPADKKAAKKAAPEPPLRLFSASPDGTRGLGVYASEVFDTSRKTHPADILMMFALDGTAARRKAIQNGVPVEWSHDSKWTLVQDGSSACIMAATGGQYKCWRGYTAVAIAPDGKYALVLGNRDRARSEDKKSKKAKKSKKPKKPEPDTVVEEPGPGAEAEGEGESADPVADELPLPPPTGPLALYRAQLDGPYSTSPVLVTRDVDGAAVWLPH